MVSQKPPPNRIAELRLEKGWSQEELAQATGTSNQQISMLEKGQRRLTVEWMERLAAAFGDIDPAELLARKGAHTAVRRSNAEQMSQPIYEEKGSLFGIDELDVRAHAGGGAMVEHEKKIATWSIPRDVIRGQTTAPANVLKIITVRGDSMEPTLMPGQRIMVDLEDTAPSPPGLFVVWDGLGLVVKRVYLLPDGDPLAVELLSDNKEYPTYRRTLDEAHIRGRVVGFWRWT